MSSNFSFGSFVSNPSNFDKVPFSLSSSAKTSTPRAPKLSFGASVPAYSDPFNSGQKLAFPTSVTPKRQSSSTFFESAGDFLSGASFGTAVGDLRNSPGIYPDAILRTAGQAANAAGLSVPTRNSTDGFKLDNIKNIAKGILGSIGSSGDGPQVVPVSYQEERGGETNYLLIAVGVLAAGGLAYAVTR